MNYRILWWWDYVMVVGPVEVVEVSSDGKATHWEFRQRYWLEPREWWNR